MDGVVVHLEVSEKCLTVVHVLNIGDLDSLLKVPIKPFDLAVHVRAIRSCPLNFDKLFPTELLTELGTIVHCILRRIAISRVH